MTFKSIVGVICAYLTVVSINANAIVINTSIGLYDITTVSGTYLEHRATLQQQVWWGNESLAYEMMSLTEGFDGLGYPNTGYNESPYFAYDDLTVAPDDISVIAWTTATGSGCSDSRSNLCGAFQIELDGICFPELGFPCVWGVAQAVTPSVPVPTAFWLFGSGLISLIGATRRKKS